MLSQRFLIKITTSPVMQSSSVVLEEIVDDEVMEIPPSNKKRARRPRTPLDVRFLRRSKRLNLDLTTPEEARDASATAGKATAVGEQTTSTAPHLPIEVALALGTNFLKMGPEDLSAAAMEAPYLSGDDE